MDASNFARGDRVRLVRMDDPYVEDVPIGKTGTVLDVAGKPINVLMVDWDGGDFNLNPCLDVDVVEKVGDVRRGREFYTVRSEGGCKLLKYEGFTWRRDNDELPYALTTIVGCEVEVGDDNYIRMAEQAERCQQYQEDMTERGFFEANVTFFDGGEGEMLNADEVTVDTPDGCYWFEED